MNWKYDWLYEIQFTSLCNSHEREHTGFRAHRVGEEPHCRELAGASSAPGEGASRSGRGPCVPNCPRPPAFGLPTVRPAQSRDHPHCAGQDTEHSRTAELAGGQSLLTQTIMSYTRKQGLSPESELEIKN